MSMHWKPEARQIAFEAFRLCIDVSFSRSNKITVVLGSNVNVTYFQPYSVYEF